MESLKIPKLSFTVDFSGLESVEKFMLERIQLIVDKAANDIKRLSQLKVPVDQGVAKASHYVVSATTDERNEAIQEASTLAASEESRYGHKGRNIGFDSEEAELLPYHAFICVAVGYALELETGYISGSLNVRAQNPGASRPFLTPSVMEYEDTFISACRASFGDLL